MKLKNGQSRKIEAPKMSYQLTINNTSTPTSSGTDVFFDLNRTHGDITTNTAYIIATDTNTSSSVNLVYESLTPNIAKVSPDGVLTCINNGTAIIVAHRSGCPTSWYKIGVSVPVSIDGTIQFLSFANGTLGKELANGVDSRITSVTSENLVVKVSMFSTYSPLTYTFVRNTSFWAADVDTTCFSIGNTSATGGGVLISPRHITFASHWPMVQGSTIGFVTTDNQLITRTVSNVITNIVGESDAFLTDIGIAILDSDVPSTISFAKIMPENFEKYLPSYSHNVVPVMMTNQSRIGAVHAIHDIYRDYHFQYQTTKGTSDGISTVRSASYFATRYLMYNPCVHGDSGSPCFAILNGEVVLLFSLTGIEYSDGSFGSSNISKYINEINTAMATLQGGVTPYQLTTVDLSGFTYFG